MWTLPAADVPCELGVRNGSRAGVESEVELEPRSSAPWLDVPLSNASLRGEAEVARAAATLCWASLCGCASEVDFDVAEDDKPNVIEVPGLAEDDVAMAARESEAQPHSSGELYG